MWRVMGLALVFVVGAAAPAEADDQRRSGIDIVPDAQQAATPAGMRRGVQVPVPLSGTLAPTRSSLRLSWGGLRREELSTPAIPGALPPEPRERSASATLPWVSQGKSDLALPVTERFLVGVGYRHVEGEDLWRDFAETGSVDYDSHDVLLRAHWRF